MGNQSNRDDNPALPHQLLMSRSTATVRRALIGCALTLVAIVGTSCGSDDEEPEASGWLFTTSTTDETTTTTISGPVTVLDDELCSAILSVAAPCSGAAIRRECSYVGPGETAIEAREVAEMFGCPAWAIHPEGDRPLPPTTEAGVALRTCPESLEVLAERNGGGFVRGVDDLYDESMDWDGDGVSCE